VAAGLTPAVERRRLRRLRPEDAGWQRLALLRPGHEVEVLNLSARGALVRTAVRLKPGARGELQLTGETRRAVRGRIDRAKVVRLEPLCYEAAIVFDETLGPGG
jgi:hypothetical protein